MNISDLTGSCGQWLSCPNTDYSNIVISSRIRLARNLNNFNFMPKISDEDKINVAEEVASALNSTGKGNEFQFFDLENLSKRERSILMERHLISRELIENTGRRGVAFNDDESLSVMINEEDHIRLQSLRGGFSLQQAYETIDKLDDQLAGILDYAYDPELGYLTSCPTNVGTGIRVSVMMHLPALVMTRSIEKAFRAIHDLRLAVRGFYGEGTEALGEIYQISNQITLGRSEQELIDDLKAVIEELAVYETRAREKLITNDRFRLEDRVWRSYATLKNARVLFPDEAMQLLSGIRLGMDMKILPSITPEMLNKIFLFSQPAHLQQIIKEDLKPKERDIARANYVREQFKDI